MADQIYNIIVKDIQGRELRLEEYQGKVLLIVNVASRCGFTPQYEELERLYRKHQEKGLVVLGFPCNQFGKQEPGSEEEIQTYCSLNYDVTFPLFSKVEVKGPNAHPLYKFLTKSKGGFLGTKAVKWNFTKFLVNRNGVVVGRFGSLEKPSAIEPAILKLL